MLLKKITKGVLFITLAVPPLMVAYSLIFPFVSGKVYLFRFLVQISFLLWLFLIIKKSENKPNFKNPLVITTLLFLVALIITAFFGVDLIYSFFSGFERADGVIQFSHWVLYFLLLISVLKSKKDWQLFLGAFLVLSFIISLYGWFNIQAHPRIYGTFGNPSYLAAFLIFAIGFAMVMLVERQTLVEKFSFFKSNTLPWFLLAFFFILTLFFTKTRGAYLGLAGGFVLFAVLAILFLRKEKKKLIIYSSSILIIGLIFIGILFSCRETQFVKNNSTLWRLTNSGDITRVFRERLLTWQIAVKSFQDKPFFGWGVENFGSAFNKHYDYRVGLEQPWFDRVHNQPIQVLAEGGLFLFFFYLLWVFSIFYLIFKIFKEKKLLAIILASTYFSFLIQGLFLFDTFGSYLGLFPFLGFVYFTYQSIYCSKNLPVLNNKNKKKFGNSNFLTNCLSTIGVFFVVFLAYTTIWIPYKANSLTLKCYAYTRAGRYEEALSFLEQASKTKSPYAYFEVRKFSSWELLGALDVINEKTTKKDIESATELYKFLSQELEKAADYRPFDPQIYYLLGRIYRLGFEKLGQNDLDKAEIILNKSFNFSRFRIEYFDELAQVLVLQKKFEEAENLVKGYIENINTDDPYPYAIMGHLYFVEGKYDLAMSQYQEAKKRGYGFWRVDRECARYLFTAEKLKDYQKIVEMSLEYLENRGPDADSFFNAAVAYRELKDYQKAREFFFKALELNSEVEEYRPFFEIP